MRYLLILIIVISALIDTCMADHMIEATAEDSISSTSILSTKGPCSHFPSGGSHHESSSQDTDGICHDCHIGHSGYIAETYQWPSSTLGDWKMTYQFFAPFPSLGGLRRPPKISA